MELSDTVLQKIGTHRLKLSSDGHRIAEMDAAVVWQYVRHNPQYKSEYEKLKIVSLKAADDDSMDFHNQIFCRTWHMSLPLDYRTPMPPRGFYFDSSYVKAISNMKLLRPLAEWQTDRASLVLLINLDADRKLIDQQISSVLDVRHKKVSAAARVKGSSVTHATDNFICFYLKEIKKLKNKDIKARYASMKIGGTLQDRQLLDKVRSFKTTAAQAPWCFLNAPR